MGYGMRKKRSRRMQYADVSGLYHTERERDVTVSSTQRAKHSDSEQKERTIVRCRKTSKYALHYFANSQFLIDTYY